MDVSSPAVVAEYSLPPLLHAAIVREAVHDADRVAAFLHVFCAEFDRLHPESGIAGRWKGLFPAAFLLNLTAALRLLSWEENRQIKPEFGLPRGADYLSEVMHNMAKPATEPLLFRRLLQIFVEAFVWSARAEIGGNVSLDAQLEDDLADKIAAFLWNHRNDL
jgi:hypothetical protein